MRWGWLALVLTVMGAAADTKLVLSAVTARGTATEAAADAVGRALTSAFSDVEGLRVTRVQSAEGLADRHSGYSVGELGPQIAAATGADWVVFAALAEQDSSLLCLSAYQRAAGVVRLFEPASLPLREADRRVAVAAVAKLAWQRWQAASGTVVGRAPDELVGIQLERSPGDGPGPYRLAVQPPVLLVEGTAERIAPPPISLAMGELVRTEAATAWFRLAAGEALEPGTQVVVAPAAALPPPAPGRGAVIASRPRLAEVLSDSRLLGVTPLWLPEAAIAGAALELRHPGSLPWRRTLTADELASGLLAAELTAAAAPASTTVTPHGVRLRVESLPPGAEVRLDGVPKGLTPLELEGVLGRPEVTVHRAGFQVWRAQVVASGPLTLRAELVSAFGQLEVTSQPAGAEVYVDGKQQGVTPLGLSGVPVGRHELRVVAPTGDTRAREVMIEPGGVTRAEIRFREPPAMQADGPAPRLEPTPPAAQAAPRAAEPQPPTTVLEPAPRVAPVQPQVQPQRSLQPPAPSAGQAQPAEAQSSTGGALPLVTRPEDSGASAPRAPAGETLRSEPVARPVRPEPPAAVIEPTPFRSEPEHEPQTAAPAPRLPRRTAPASFKAGPILWQMKIDSLGGRLNLVAAAVEDGVVFSITLAPGRTYLTGPADRGFKLVYPGTSQTEGWAFALDEVPEIDAVRLEPDRDRGGALAILLDLASGVEARIHPSSTLERARIICRHPATTAGPVEVMGQ